MGRALLTLVLCGAAEVWAEKATITWKPPDAGVDDRPLVREVVVAPQGSDYAFKIEFTQPPWGDACKTHCANATLFLDTDNNKDTGLKLKDPKAPETGADLAVTIQGTRDYVNGSSHAVLRVKVKQFTEEATSVDQGQSLAELEPTNDAERVLSEGTSVYLLIDANIGNLPQGAKTRLVYHPPEVKPLTGLAQGMLAPGATRVELFKDGKLTNPVKARKSVYEKL